jgi:hypothetical protein
VHSDFLLHKSITVQARAYHALRALINTPNLNNLGALIPTYFQDTQPIK